MVLSFFPFSKRKDQIHSTAFPKTLMSCLLYFYCINIRKSNKNVWQPQLANTCSKLTIETLKQDAKFVQI